MKRCSWCSSNLKYIDYHDNEWCLKNDLSDRYLLEMLILESFQAGLSWECILNKRENFKVAYDDFDVEKIILYCDIDIERLMSNKGIVRNRLKVLASISNSKIFKNIILEFGSFYNYLCSFFDGNVIYEVGCVTNWLSDKISKDLIKRGMKFVGSTIIYSYLQAIGIIYSHEEECFLCYTKQ